MFSSTRNHQHILLFKFKFRNSFPHADLAAPPLLDRQRQCYTVAASNLSLSYSRKPYYWRHRKLRLLARPSHNIIFRRAQRSARKHCTGQQDSQGLRESPPAILARPADPPPIPLLTVAKIPCLALGKPLIQHFIFFAGQGLLFVFAQAR